MCQMYLMSLRNPTRTHRYAPLRIPTMSTLSLPSPWYLSLQVREMHLEYNVHEQQLTLKQCTVAF